jgi:type II secretory pathway component PulM
MDTPRIAHRMAAPLARWWSGKNDGERRVIAVLAVVAGACLAWWVIWQPLERDIGALRIAAARNKTALAGAHRIAEEIAGIARSNPPEPAADARAGLERVLAQRAISNAVTQLEWQDGRVHLVFAAIGYDALIAALEAIQRDARLRVVEATLTARVDPGTVRADMVLTR